MENAPAPVAARPPAAKPKAKAKPKAAAREDDEQDHARQNAQDRGIAGRWLATRPMGRIFLMRALLEPLRCMLQEMLLLSDDRWEVHQRAAAARWLRARTRGPQ